MPKASGRFGVIAISITASILFGLFTLSQSKNRSPTCPDESSIMPSCSSLMPISRSEHIIPALSTPRIFPTPIVESIPGIYDPGLATTTFIPVLALTAPQIICFSPSSVWTRQTRNLSAFGCCSVFIILPIVKFSRFAVGSKISSTSKPKSVSASAISETLAVVSKCSFNQEKVNFIFEIP